MANKLGLIIVLLASVSLSHALSTPQAYQIFPYPVLNQTSSIFCGFVNSTANELSNITANITYVINGSTIVTGTFNNSGANNQTTIYEYNFPSEAPNSEIVVICRFMPQNIVAYSLMQTIKNNSFGSTSNDDLTSGTLIGLAILVVILIYLHIHAKGTIWAEFWFFLACLITITDLLSILSFANDEGADGIATVALALFVGFFAVFLLSLYLFIWDLIMMAFKGIKEAYNGTKK